MKHNIAKILICTGAACVTLGAIAAPALTKSDYEAAKDRAASNYKAAHEQCERLAGNPKDVCIAEAKAAKVHAESDAEAQYKNTPSAVADARKTKASADYDVNKAKCESQTGNAKDVCVKQAKATLVAAEADAKADKKSGDARADAADDKNSADYKVALEKCEAYAGPTKDTCVADVKSRYGK